VGPTFEKLMVEILKRGLFLHASPYVLLPPHRKHEKYIFTLFVPPPIE